MKRGRDNGYVFGMPVRARVVISLVSALIVAGKLFLNLPLHIPGHSGFFWMALLAIGVGATGRLGAGTLIGLLTAILATVLLPGRQGPLTGVKYFVPGLVFDVLTPLLGGRLDRPVVGAIIAAAANLSKLLTAYVLGLIAGIPGGFLAMGLGFAATTHVVFGALGGWIGAFVLGKLEKAGLTEEPVEPGSMPFVSSPIAEDRGEEVSP